MNVEDIKYKLYIKEEKTVYQIHAIDIDFNSSDFDMTILYGNNTVRVPFYSHEVVLLPFTGFKDKNGTEIYEGNILQDIDNSDIKYVIRSDKCNLYAEEYIKGKYIDSNSVADYNHEGKIVGNIWENPELLKE